MLLLLDVAWKASMLRIRGGGVRETPLMVKRSGKKKRQTPQRMEGAISENAVCEEERECLWERVKGGRLFVRSVAFQCVRLYGTAQRVNWDEDCVCVCLSADGEWWLTAGDDES